MYLQIFKTHNINIFLVTMIAYILLTVKLNGLIYKAFH